MKWSNFENVNKILMDVGEDKNITDKNFLQKICEIEKRLLPGLGVKHTLNTVVRLTNESIIKQGCPLHLTVTRHIVLLRLSNLIDFFNLKNNG